MRNSRFLFLFPLFPVLFTLSLEVNPVLKILRQKSNCHPWETTNTGMNSGMNSGWEGFGRGSHLPSLLIPSPISIPLFIILILHLLLPLISPIPFLLQLLPLSPQLPPLIIRLLILGLQFIHLVPCFVVLLGQGLGLGSLRRGGQFVLELFTFCDIGFDAFFGGGEDGELFAEGFEI